MEVHGQYNLEPGAREASLSHSPSLNVERIDKDFNIKNFYTFTDREATFKKGQKFNRTGFSTVGLGVSGAVYSVAVQDYLVGITDLSYAPSIGLPKPSLVGPGKTYIIKDEAGGALTTTITVRSAGEENIDGSATSTIVTAYGSKGYYSDGANWFTYQT